MSPLLSPDLAFIARELDALVTGQGAGAAALVIRAPSRRPEWPDEIERHGRRFRLAWCASQLDMRERLDAASVDEGVVVMTPLEFDELGSDVVARLPRGRMIQADRWMALRSAFKVREIDPRLRSQRWLADLLLSDPPRAGYPPAAGDLLDLDTAWHALLEGVLGLPDGRCGPADLLEWTLNSTGPGAFLSMTDEARAAVVNRVRQQGGGAASLVIGGVGAGKAAEMMPFGLACTVVFAEGSDPAALRDAAVRLERLVGDVPLVASSGLVLGGAAGRVLTRLLASDPNTARTVQVKADSLLADVRATEWRASSPALDSGLDARMSQAGAALAIAAASGIRDDVGAASALVQRCLTHERAGERRSRLDRLMMAVRLTRWLADGPAVVSRTVADAARTYAEDGSYADLARHQLRSGDELVEVGAAYVALRDRALTRREIDSRAFAETLRDWMARGAPGTDPMPVETILETVVAPLARSMPILLLVMDGLSFPVWHSIADDLGRQGWTMLQAVAHRGPMIGAAALPSVTEVSRTSLLSGALGRGDQTHERARFAAHPALLREARQNRPRLFHRGDLGAGPDLEPPLRDALADVSQRIVGVVHNAVDAQLSGSDQLQVAWSVDALRHLSPILRLARDVGRVVVITGDHGHVVDEGTTRAARGDGGRWRESGAAVGEGELAVAGSRVLSPDGRRSIVAAWSERVRNGAPRNGYHGGISPQEVLVPVAVLTAGSLPEGWIEAPPTFPAWWSGDRAAAEAQTTARTAERSVVAGRGQPSLLSLLESPPAASAATPAPEAPPWLALLFASDSYGAQRRLASRGVPRDDQTKDLLVALASRGGRVSQVGLAASLSLPLVRVPGLVNAARRVLNLDQAQVLRIEDRDVILDVGLLKSQFQLQK